MKAKNITAYILNFLIFGSGFVVIAGWKGFKIGILYFIPLILLTIFNETTPYLFSLDTLNLFIRLVIFIISFIHLSFFIKNFK